MLVEGLIIHGTNGQVFFKMEAFDSFDGERNLVSCDTYTSLWLSCSTFSDFKSILLPDGTGSVQGILTRDFFDSKYILKINNPTDIVFQDSRCDPFFEENFESNPLGLFEKEGWTPTMPKRVLDFGK